MQKPTKDKKEVKGFKGKVLSSFTELMPVRLSDMELLVAGAKLAEAEREARDQEKSAQTIKADLNAKKKAADEKLADLAAIVRNKSESRQTLVQVEMDPKDGRYCWEIRTDTGEVIRRRPLQDNERQRTLPLDDKAAELKALAEKAIKDNLDAPAIRELATKKKLDPEKLLAEVNAQKNKVRHLTTADAKPADSAVVRIAKKLFAEDVRSDTLSKSNARVEEAAKAAGVSVEDVVAELREIEKRILKQDADKPEKK